MFSDELARHNASVKKDLDVHLPVVVFCLLNGEGMPSLVTVDVRIQLVVAITEDGRDNSNFIACAVLLPNRKVPVSKLFATRASVDMQNILPRRRHSAGASNFCTDAELIETRGRCELVAWDWSHKAVVDETLAAVEAETGVDRSTWWGDVRLRLVPEVSYSEERRWRMIGIRGVDGYWSRVRVQRIDDVASKGFSVLEHRQLEHVIVGFLLRDLDCCPGLVLAIHPVLNFVERVPLHRPIKLQSSVRVLPNSKVSVSELVSASTPGHVDDTLPSMAGGLVAEDVHTGRVNRVSINGPDYVAPLGLDGTAVDEGVAVVKSVARVDTCHWSGHFWCRGRRCCRRGCRS